MKKSEFETEKGRKSWRHGGEGERKGIWSHLGLNLCGVTQISRQRGRLPAGGKKKRMDRLCPHQMAAFEIKSVCRLSCWKQESNICCPERCPRICL